MVYQKQLPNSKRRILNQLTTRIEEGNLESAKILLNKHFTKGTDIYHFFSGWILQSSGKYKKSIKEFSTAVTINPSHEDSLVGLAISYYELKELKLALECIECAHSFSKSSSVLTTYAIILGATHPSQAAKLLEEAFLKADNNTQYVEILGNLGANLYKLKRYDEAIARLETAKKLSEFDYTVNVNLASVYATVGRIEEALECNEIAQLARRDDLQELMHQEGLLNLLLGKKKGWRLCEYRKKKFPIQVREYSAGNVGKVLVWQEQGIGDLVQFTRYIPLIVRDSGQKVDMVVHPNEYSTRESIKEFVEFWLSDYIDKVYILGDQIEHIYDFGIGIMSLPYQYKFEIPKPIPIPHTPYNDFEYGVFWQGSTKFSNDSNRSIHTEYIKEFAIWHTLSLQKDKYPELEMCQPCPGTIIDLVEQIASCKTIITVDSLVAHLAGTMNKPTYLLHSFSPDWRWGLTSKETEWYSSIVNIRQDSFGNWDSVFTQLRNELKLS